MKINRKRDEVGRILETSYGIDINTVEKILQNSFQADQMPPWFLFSKNVHELSQLLYVSSQVMNADTEHLSVTSEDGKAITYFINVGRDVPGKLREILDENSEIDLISFDSVKVGSGRRVVTLEKRGRHSLPVEGPIASMINAIVDKVREYAAREGYKNVDRFLAALPPNYLLEEAKYDSRSGRILRHLDLFDQVLESRRIVFRSSELPDASGGGEKRIAIAAPAVSDDFPREVLGLVRRHNLNLSRTFWDLFDDPSDPVGIISLYFTMSTNLESLMADLINAFGGQAAAVPRSPENNAEWEFLVRSLSAHGRGPLGRAPDDAVERLRRIRAMAAKNVDFNVTGDSMADNLLLNALCGFFDAAEHVGLGEAEEVLIDLIAFERFDEFWVNAKKNGKRSNAEGFRVKHSTLRGPGKGGIRNAPIVDFAEVSGLSFLMTWKCARTGILFGGGKGGLKIDPSRYAGNQTDFLETLSSYGRALFHVTGPAEDVPAGDLGCGPVEIGCIFEGFKAALHDLAMIAGGVKKSGAVLGQKVVSLGEARRILSNNYDVDVYDPAIVAELASSEKFLELVAASHITGKPRMGITARNGATGRGLCYALLATVANEYSAGLWNVDRELNGDEQKRIETLIALDSGEVGEKDWKALRPVFVRLLKGRRVIVQGSGKVGSSLMTELAGYGVKFVAVADGGGAVTGQSLNLDTLLNSALQTGSVVNIDTESSVKIIQGAEDGSAVLTGECDILVLAALENAVTVENASEIQASLIACGSNGPITPKAEAVLHERGITVIYDMLANSGGVTASYFEWLRNLSDRLLYEAEIIRQEEYDPSAMDPYLMPQYAHRIKDILSHKESEETTAAWNTLIRDIIVTSINVDYRLGRSWNTPMKTAGFADAILRVLSARIMKAEDIERETLWRKIPPKTAKALAPYLRSAESRLFAQDAETICQSLYSSKPTEKEMS